MASHRDDQRSDDWFDEPELPLERRRRREWGEAESEDDADRWVVPDRAAERPRRRRQREPLYVGGRQVTTTQVALIAGSAVAILLAILAAAGAFSSGPKRAAPPATLSTNPIVPATTSKQTTTPTTAQPLAQAPTATLKPGDTGDQVVLLQKALTALGYSPGNPDGNYGSGTQQAVSAFQTAKGLAADGVVGPATLAALRTALSGTSSSSGTTTGAESTVQAPSTTLNPGDTGQQVVLLQQALTSLGYSTGSADGNYGATTKAAVTSFQQAKGLTADGVVGPQTLLALQQALAGPTG